jgi:hypothetical protein
MRADLELRRVPAGVCLRRTKDVAELDLRCRPVGCDVESEADLEQLLGLVPIDLGIEVDARATSVTVCEIVDSPTRRTIRKPPCTGVIDCSSVTSVTTC